MSKAAIAVMQGEPLETFVLRCAADPVFFAREVLNLKRLPTDSEKEDWELDQWQCDMLNALSDAYRKQHGIDTIVNHEGKSFVTVRSMHGPGKTFGSALAMHWFQFCFPGQVFVAAPKHKQITTRTWGEFRKILHRAPAWYQAIIDVKDTRISWFGDKDWAAFAESAKQPENMAGKHWPHQLVIIEEATGVPESLWPVIFGALSTGPLQLLLMISNPTRNSGTFASSQLDQREAHLYHRMHIRLEDTRRVSKQWVENLRRKYGEKSPIFRIRCLGEFATDDANQLIASAWVANAWDRDWTPDGSHHKLRVSVDVADGGDNESVCTVAHHYMSNVRLIKQTTHNFPSETANTDTADVAERLFLAHGGDIARDDFVVDSVGVGTGVASTLVTRGYRVVRYKGGEDSSNNKRWRNRRVQSYMVMRDAFRDGHISFDDDFTDDATELQAQLCSVKTNPNTERVEDLQTKEAMRADGIKSPDRADSIAMQYATQAPVMARSSQRSNEVYTAPSTVLEGYEG